MIAASLWRQAYRRFRYANEISDAHAHCSLSFLSALHVMNIHDGVVRRCRGYGVFVAVATVVRDSAVKQSRDSSSSSMSSLISIISHTYKSRKPSLKVTATILVTFFSDRLTDGRTDKQTGRHQTRCFTLLPCALANVEQINVGQESNFKTGGIVKC